MLFSVGQPAPSARCSPTSSPARASRCSWRACSLVDRQRRSRLANGALWGAAGWLAVHLLPAIGLPPELPGFPAADLGDRQVWWVATVGAFGRGALPADPEGRDGGEGRARIVLHRRPHVYGAPQPTDIASNVPAVLARGVRGGGPVATALFFWVVLGLSLRLRQREDRRQGGLRHDKRHRPEPSWFWAVRVPANPPLPRGWSPRPASSKHYIATGRAWDEEMRARIDQHRGRARRPWLATHEEPLELVERIKRTRRARTG